MNSLELLVAVSLSLLLILILIRSKTRTLETFAGGAGIIIGIFLLFDQSTQFFTYDETDFFWEATSIATTALMQWLLGALRTSDILVGSAMHVIRAATSLPFFEYQMLAKIVHAIFGILCLWLIWMLLARLVKGRISLSIPAFLVLIIFQPVLMMSMKVITYDMFSMLLGIASILLIGIGLKEKSKTALFFSIVVAFLAAQEKLIASPLLWISIVVFGWVSGTNNKQDLWFRRMTFIFLNCCFGFCIAIATNIGSHLILLLNRGPNGFTALIKMDLFFYPIYSLVFILVRTLGGDTLASTYVRWMLDSGFLWACTLTGTAVAALFIVSCMLALADPNKFFNHSWIKRFKEILPATNSLLFLSLLVLAFCAWLFLEGYTFPRVKIPPGCFIPPASFNGVSIFYKAHLAAGHMWFSYLWANLWFFIAIPSVVPLALIISWIINPLAGIKSKTPACLELVMFLCMLVPLGYALTQTPALNRYFNIFVLLITLAVLARLSESLEKIGARAGAIIVTMLALIAAIEMYPFRPLYGSFRPFWYNLSENVNKHQVFPTKPVWTGWGEEVMLAGKKIQKEYLKDDTGHVNFYFNFIGDWVRKKDNITVTSVMTRIADGKYMQAKDSLIHVNAIHTDTLSYTSHDFYIINRQGLLYQKDIPESIPPLFTIDFRGFTQAWVYRGDQFTHAGFAF